MSEIKIAPTTSAQLGAVLDQTRATFETHRARLPRSFPDKLLLKLEDRHRGAVDLAETDATSYSATKDGQHVGFILLRAKWGAGMVYDIATFPNTRQQGVGRALLNHGIEVAGASAWPILVASVWDGNEASHRLFQSAGFHATKPYFKRMKWLFPVLNATTYTFELKSNDRPL